MVTFVDLSFVGWVLHRDDFDYILARLFFASSHPLFSVSPRHLVCLSLLFLAASVFAYLCFACTLCTIFGIFFECFLLLSIVFKIYFEFLMLQFGWVFFFWTSAIYLFVSVLGLVSSSLYIYIYIYTSTRETYLN